MNKGFVLAIFVCASASGAHVYYTASGTATSTAGSSGPVNIGVTFDTFQDSVQVSIQNFVTGASRDVQAISAVDFVLSTGQTAASISSQSGLVRAIDSAGNWTAGDPAHTPSARPVNFSDSSYAGAWIVQAGGALVSGLSNSLDLTAFSGGNPSLTILGAPSGTNQYNSYGNPNNAVTKHNAYLASDGQAVVFTLSAPGVTSGTTILTGGTTVRFFFGTDRSAFLNASLAAPEPATKAIGGFGLLGLLLLGMRRSAAARRNRGLVAHLEPFRSRV